MRDCKIKTIQFSKTISIFIVPSMEKRVLKYTIFVFLLMSQNETDLFFFLPLTLLSVQFYCLVVFGDEIFEQLVRDFQNFVVIFLINKARHFETATLRSQSV
ncbi:hypothetical protein L3Y34_018060 [Caenorhabditis briggsae]|uniref:Uncharacterized protein n=1 Tax=Caenorhabditis briggsae TaxID=6238 RepID=A0AAE9IU53_CAEBR|nr:hypothetical protein L3Y34_018060 [Caenorhabditis briggsae]